MINAKELRIGNWARNSYGDVWRITGQDITWCSMKSKKYYGILLTPELLLKCGFEYDQITFSLGKIMLAEAAGGFNIFPCGLSGGKFHQILHLHQLQNLYYALTGEELKIEF